jgi:glycosyltransferase involved in cell wall biosynthesis
MVPFVHGGAEILADGLKDKLVEYGYEAQIIHFPFSWNPCNNIVDCMLSAQLTKLVNVDLMIGLKFPAYLIPHENKKLWLLHQFRDAYDLAGTEYDFFVHFDNGQIIKNIIIQNDNKFIKPLEGNIFTISQVISDRLKRYNDIESTVLYPPLANKDMFYFGETGDYIFYPSRVSAGKRQKLMVEAMRYTKSKVKLILAGKGDSKQDEEIILRLIEKYNISDKVTYLSHFISEKEKSDLYANCLGVAFIPVDEDYGYITIEAFQSCKPVITCKDSGCPANFVKNGQCGYIVEPSAVEIAAKMDIMYQNSNLSKEMGQNAKLRLKELDINWDTVIMSLVQ